MSETTYDPREQDDIIEAILPGLRATLADGGRKRAAGTKPHWTIDSHEGPAFSHIAKAKKGEKVDPDSGVHPYYHTAIRFAMMAWQATHRRPRWGESDGDWELNLIGERPY